MKKTSKKNKIIILIAIALIIVIIGILIGTNTININILTGKFNSANGSSNNGNLLPEYIKAGITLGGVTGTLEDLDTSDATATPEDIAKGKTAYVDGKKITGTRAVPITDINLADIYYADLTGDGTPDGIIYADLAVGGRGEWGTNGWGKYEIPSETNLKQYYIEKENYNGVFGTGKVIAPMKGTSGNERFYVMALQDVNPGEYYSWYGKASGKLDHFVDYADNDFGQGRTNTEYVMSKWNNPSLPWGNHNGGLYPDIWGEIENEISEGWFLPSKSEWAAFGAALNIESSNFKELGLKEWYWSSSQYNLYNAYDVFLIDEKFNTMIVENGIYVRLSTTF